MHDTEQFEQQPFGVVNDYTNLFHTAGAAPVLRALLKRAEADHVPVVTPNVSHLLEMLVTLRQPRCILELGTAYGVSAYHMLKGLAAPATLVTIDLVRERQAVAQEFLHDAGLDCHEIVFECADFREEGYFARLAERFAPFDLVFIDAAKGQYAHLLEEIMPHLSAQGAVVFDNIFLNGWLVADAYPNHRQKTAFVRMKQFLQEVQQDARFAHTLLPLDDGVLVLARRQEDRNETEH